MMKSILLRTTVICCITLASVPSKAQWWWPAHAPRDFEECSANAEKTAVKPEERASLMSQCDAKFSGRRKPGGGYTYYDFMQNRHFDIAGPNPTAEELRHMDEEYTLYLGRERQNAIAAAVAAAIADKQKQQAKAEFESDTRSIPVQPPASAGVPPPLPRPAPARSNAQPCKDASFSCSLSKLSERVKSFFEPSSDASTKGDAKNSAKTNAKTNPKAKTAAKT